MCASFPDRRNVPRARPPAFDLPSPHTTLHRLRRALNDSTRGSMQVLPGSRHQARQPEYSDRDAQGPDPRCGKGGQGMGGGTPRARLTHFSHSAEESYGGTSTG